MDMSPERWSRIKFLFNAALDCEPSQREAFFAGIDDADDELIAEVRRLVVAESVDAFSTPVADVASLWRDDAPADLTGKRFGDYTLVREIGRGGMGVVFEAVREKDDFAQTVALKLLKRGMDSDAMLRRFRTERQILASLEHPNIARLLDGGMTDDGLPFFALEFVRGKPLDEYCRDNELSLNARLRLFQQVCAAVSFAHSRLVVHRDLKPTNILVTDDGTVKLLDFGIAKIISPDPDSADKTATALGMMTPAYASPEQVRGEIVSTSSDIYSLGLILFEILTGVPAHAFKSNSAAEMSRVICEEEPRRPSSVVVSERTGNTSEVKGRTTNSGFPDPRALRGDLDNIVMKALRKDISTRYASVEQLAGDIARYLDGLPVTARAVTFSYRLKKFAGRNRAAVIAGVVVLISLIAGIAATSWQAYRAEKQRRLAEKRFGEVRELANNAVFKYYDQIKDLQGATEARATLLTDAATYLDRLAADAQNDVALQKDLINAYVRLGDIMGAPHDNANTGDTAAALENYTKSLKIADSLNAQTPDDWEIVGKQRALHTKLGEVYQRIGDAAQTKDHFKTAVELSQKIAAHEPESPKQLSALGQAFVLYGETLPLGVGENESVTVSSKGFEFLDKALAIAPDDSPSLQRKNTAHIRIGLQLMSLARDADEGRDPRKANEYYERAADFFHQSIAEATKLVASDAKNAGFRRRKFVSEFNESTALSGLGKTDEALVVQRRMLDETRAVAKESKNAEAKFDLAQSLYELGNTFFRRGDFSAAKSNINEAIEVYDQIVSADPSNGEVVKSRFEAKLKLGTVMIAEKNFADAESAFENAIATLRSAEGMKNNADYLGFAEGWKFEKSGDLLAARGDLANARAEYQKALAAWSDEKSSPSNLGFSAAKIEYLRQKSAR